MRLEFARNKHGAMLVLIVTLAIGCMKDNSPLIAKLADNIATVEQWPHDSDWRERVAWLDRHIAWDITLAITMTWAAHDVEDQERVEELLRSGLAEVAAGPDNYIVSIVNDWRRTLGTGRCRIGAASDDDVRWAGARLAMPAPRGAGPESRQALAGYAKRASDTRDFVRIECGGPAHMIVGVLGGRLVPIMRE